MVFFPSAAPETQTELFPLKFLKIILPGAEMCCRKQESKQLNTTVTTTNNLKYGSEWEV